MSIIFPLISEASSSGCIIVNTNTNIALRLIEASWVELACRMTVLIFELLPQGEARIK